MIMQGGDFRQNGWVWYNRHDQNCGVWYKTCVQATHIRVHYRLANHVTVMLANGIAEYLSALRRDDNSANSLLFTALTSDDAIDKSHCQSLHWLSLVLAVSVPNTLHPLAN